MISTMISNSVNYQVPQRDPEAVIKGPMTHAWKGTDKILPTPQRKLGVMWAQELMLKEG